MGRHLHAPLVVIPSLAVCAWSVLATAQVAPDIEPLMRLIGERVAEYQRRVQNVMCVERSTVQPIQSNLSPDGFSRTVESEVRVEFDADGGSPSTAKVGAVMAS